MNEWLLTRFKSFNTSIWIAKDFQPIKLQCALMFRLNSISDGESSVCDFFLQNMDDLLNVEEEIVLTRTSFFGMQ